MSVIVGSPLAVKLSTVLTGKTTCFGQAWRFAAVVLHKEMVEVGSRVKLVETAEGWLPGAGGVVQGLLV